MYVEEIAIKVKIIIKCLTSHDEIAQISIQEIVAAFQLCILINQPVPSTPKVCHCKE